MIMKCFIESVDVLGRLAQRLSFIVLVTENTEKMNPQCIIGFFVRQSIASRELYSSENSVIPERIASLRSFSQR